MSHTGIFVGTSSQGSTTCDALPAFEPTAPNYSSERSLESIESGDEGAGEGERKACKQFDTQLQSGGRERRVSFNDKPQTIVFVGTSGAGAATCDVLPEMDVGAANVRYSKSHLEQITTKAGMYAAEKPEPSAAPQKVRCCMPSMFSKSFFGGQKR